GCSAGRLLAIQRLGQGARDCFKLAKVVAAEKVGVPQPPTFQTALEELNDILLFGKISKSHVSLCLFTHCCSSYESGRDARAPAIVFHFVYLSSAFKVSSRQYLI